MHSLPKGVFPFLPQTSLLCHTWPTQLIICSWELDKSGQKQQNLASNWGTLRALLTWRSATPVQGWRDGGSAGFWFLFLAFTDFEHHFPGD